jgi:hypothetical protein
MECRWSTPNGEVSAEGEGLICVIISLKQENLRLVKPKDVRDTYACLAKA